MSNSGAKRLKEVLRLSEGVKIIRHGEKVLHGLINIVSLWQKASENVTLETAVFISLRSWVYV
jgi:ABC-type uncharacterized transport system ATPase subunit